ncbi:MAG: enoyl-ACP reductase [Gammaproteobacteria bacterium AqS3]|nr:enoyl-ACP reductase [Gammaproteobacteria bacterium AqS3]
MGFLKGRRILIVGVANKNSIAAGIAEAMHAQGAELAFSSQNDRLKGRVEQIAEAAGSQLVHNCDVASDAEIDALLSWLTGQWDQIDGIVHAVGFAPGNELSGDYIDGTTREGFAIAHDISAYSFVALAKAARGALSDEAALLTMTYHGSTQSAPNYNTMGLAKASLEAMVRYMAASLGPTGQRVNAISAGPIRTLAASGVKDFRKLLGHASARAPLRRTVSPLEVGHAAAFLCSPLASGITGEILYVDAGFNTAAMSADEMGIEPESESRDSS